MILGGKRTGEYSYLSKLEKIFANNTWDKRPIPKTSKTLTNIINEEHNNSIKIWEIEMDLLPWKRRRWPISF